MAAGRPSKYDTQLKPYIRYIGHLRKEGMLYKDIAKMLNIAESTLYKHKSEIEEFTEAIKKGNDQLIDELEATLYDLAKGRVVRKKKKIEYFPDGRIKSREETEEQMAPNVAALIFSLTNLKPDKWSNKQEVNLEVNDDVAPSLKETLKEAYESSN